MKNGILLGLFFCMLSLHAQRADFKEIDFAKAENIAIRHQGEELTHLPALAFDLTSQLHSDVERFRAIYYWVTHNISGNHGLLSQNERYRKKLKNDPEALQQWNRKFTKEVFATLLEDKETVCTGYAYLIKVLSNLAGIECEIIHGYGTTDGHKSDPKMPNHSWNAVQLNGKWYLCDATWAAGYTDMSSFLFEFDYDNIYFLQEPSEFAKSHQPLDEKWALLTEPGDR